MIPLPTAIAQSWITGPAAAFIVAIHALLTSGQPATGPKSLAVRCTLLSSTDRAQQFGERHDAPMEG
jgi:hypothetical protein